MRVTALTLEAVDETTTGAVELTFSPRGPLPFRAGQGGLLHVTHGGTKPFTFTGDDRRGRLSIATTLASGSRFKRALGALRAGDRVHVAGSVGTLPAIAPDQPQVLVAQGIAITPFLSMARSYDHLDAVLLQVGPRHLFEETAVAMTTAEHHDHRTGLLEAAHRVAVDHPSAQWSLSGRSDFVADLAQQLRHSGVDTRRIHKDTFWGMRASTASARPAGAPAAR